MKISTRTIFFWTLVLVFIIITPAIVLYARGYRFDLHRGVFVHSGTISIKSNPQEINVSINGVLNDSKTLNRMNNSYNISGLIPDDYTLSIAADGFQTWNKKTDVHSGLASEFWNVLLVRNEYPKSDYPAEEINKFFISPKSKYIIYTRDSEQEFSANILNIKTKQIENNFNFPGWKFIPEAKKENIEWSPDEDYISVPAEKIVTTLNPKQKSILKDEVVKYNYFILDPAENTSFNLNESLNNDDISYVRWDPRDKNYLFFLSKNSLYRANINDLSELNLIASDVSSFDLSKTNVYYSVKPHELVYKANLDGSGERTQITNNFPEEITTANFRLIVYDDLRIAFLNENKGLFIFNRGELDTYSRKLSSDVEGIQFSDDGKKLLYWTKNEMSAYYLRNWNVAPTRIENSIENITRYSDEIKNVQWSKDYEHVIFSVGSQMKIIELDPRDHRNCMELPKTNLQSPIAVYNHAQERLYFVDSKDSSTSLYSIVFPEAIPFLGIYTPSNE